MQPPMDRRCVRVAAPHHAVRATTRPRRGAGPREAITMAMKTRRPAPLTDAGRARLREELDDLRLVREPQIAALLHEARDQASAAEEGDYMALQEELARIQGRIQELERSLAAERVEEAARPAGV